MSLARGTRLDAYEILDSLGAGGMGEVYRAFDSHLQRDVAIKVLPEAFSHDDERLARFEREARTLASLNHPNIAVVYALAVQPHGGPDHVPTRALVMELVEGPTLADRIALGPIPVEDALPIARQIAEALEAAHEHGIIHRDLKPANVKVRADGTVKVLDFGLAKALEPAVLPSGMSLSPTITSPAMTQAGMILGTAAYMSPEQARGKPVDRRADIWAFGCVLFEMLSGQRAVGEGETVSDTVAAILKSEPAWDVVPRDTPPRIRTLLERCLRKDLRRRLPDIASPDSNRRSGDRPAADNARRRRRAAPELLLAGGGSGFPARRGRPGGQTASNARHSRCGLDPNRDTATSGFDAGGRRWPSDGGWRPPCP